MTRAPCLSGRKTGGLEGAAGGRVRYTAFREPAEQGQRRPLLLSLTVAGVSFVFASVAGPIKG